MHGSKGLLLDFPDKFRGFLSSLKREKSPPGIPPGWFWPEDGIGWFVLGYLAEMAPYNSSELCSELISTKLLLALGLLTSLGWTQKPAQVTS